jgi:hypothetical protein
MAIVNIGVGAFRIPANATIKRCFRRAKQVGWNEGPRQAR